MRSLVLILALALQGNVPLQNGVVTGRLLTADGTPAAGVRIAAMAVQGADTASAVALASIAETGSDGRYRLENIPSGRYYITAGLVNAPTYYPGAPTPEAATEIRVAAGQTVENVNFSTVLTAGSRVSGRLVVAPSMPPNASSIGLAGPNYMMQATIHPDGSFEFQRVPPGAYTLSNSFGLPSRSVVVTDHDLADLVIGADIKGVRFSGKIVSLGSSSDVVANTTVVLTGPTGGPSLSVRSGSDGRFEFLRLAPGTYMPRVGGPMLTSIPSITIGNKDVSDFEITLPFQVDVPGHIVMADGSPFRMPPNNGVAVTVSSNGGSSSIPIQPDGSFRLRLTDGRPIVGIRNLPLGLVLESVTSGGNDMSSGILNVTQGQSISEVIVKLAAVTVDSIRGVKLSGRVPDMPASAAGSVKVVLQGTASGVSNLEATPGADGRFEFPKVPPGEYSVRASGLPNAGIGAPLQRFIVGDDNISGIQVPINVRARVSGRIVVRDSDGKEIQGFPQGVSVTFRHGAGTIGSSVRPDGAFMVPLPDGDVVISFDRLPAEFSVKSAMAGPVDLLKNSLKVDKNAPPPEIHVEMEYKP